MDKLVKEQIEFKINDIDKLFSEYELIFEKIKTATPDLFDMTILGSVLHSFYSGLENIFEIIAKNVDGNVPSGNKSHQELLLQMTTDTDKRTKVLSEDTYVELRVYATFRHFYRHAYSFQLNWEKMQPLIDNLFIVWDKVKSDLEEFIN